MVSMPLKLKYNNPDKLRIFLRETGEPESGTLIWRAKKWRPNPGQNGNGRAGQFGAFWKKKSSLKQGYGARRRSYGPF